MKKSKNMIKKKSPVKDNRNLKDKRKMLAPKRIPKQIKLKTSKGKAAITIRPIKKGNPIKKGMNAKIIMSPYKKIINKKSLLTKQQNHNP
ncbi:MAG: hypothetical protein LVQ75_00920 [Candidatus Babeliales bacterium]|jgi:hypothetical protein